MTVRKKVWFAIAVVLVFVACFALQRHTSTRELDGASEQYKRIVTMAPSTGEVVYAIGQGSKLVGVSRFMKYPKEADSLAKVGGYLDVDFEALLRLEPDLVILLEAQSALQSKLEKLGIATLSVNHMSVGGILESIGQIGECIGAAGESNKLVEEIEGRMQGIAVGHVDQEKRKVLISIGRTRGEGKVQSITAAGSDGYHQELISRLGAQNAYAGMEAFPQLNREHLLRMNPDVIIDMVNTQGARDIGVDKILADWSALPELKAVQNGHVYVLAGDKHFIPGPRFIETLEWLSAKLEELD